MVVNYPAGGPTDIEARLVARHLPKNVQGVSNVVVKNVGGAGGNIGVNQLGEANERDRLNISFFTWDPVDQLIESPSLRVRYDTLKFVAGFQMTSLVYMRRDTPPGMKVPADVVKASILKAGALSPTNHATTRQRLALDLLGAKYETIAGYKGLRDVELAMRQGLLNLTNTSLPSWHTSVRSTLIEPGLVMPVFQYDHHYPDGRIGRSPDLPDVPAFLDVYKDVHGKDSMPSGQSWRALQLLGRIMDSMYRTVFMPPNAPHGAVEEMRGAFAKLANDPEFIAEYEKVVRIKPRVVIGARGESIVAELGKVDPSFLEFLRKYLANPR